MIEFRLFLVAALAVLAVHIVLTMVIISRLQQSGVKINWFLLRLYIPKYVNQYKKSVIEKTGRTDDLYRAWVITINAAWMLALVALGFKWL